MKEVKKCSDCKFGSPDNGLVSLGGLLTRDKWNFAKCMHSEALERRTPDYHMGEASGEVRRNSCSIMRLKMSGCGPDAKLFEAKY